MDTEPQKKTSEMKRIYYFIVLFLVTLFYSCSEHSGSVISEVSIEGIKVEIDSANMYMGPKFLCADLLYAWNMDFYGGKLSTKKWQKADRILVSGSGHDEFGYMIVSSSNDGELHVLNRSWVGSKYLSLVKIPHGDSIPAVKDKTKWEKFDLKQIPVFGPNGKNFVVLSDTTILVAGTPYSDIKHLFSIIDFKNQKVSLLDYWPSEEMKCDDRKKNKRYTENSYILENKNGRYLYQNGFVRKAFIFTFDGNKTNILSTLYSDSFDEERSTEVLACCADENRIYMLLRDSDSKGTKLKEWKNPFIFGNTIEVFNWDGEKQQVIHLDEYGQNIMLSKDNKTLYLFSDYSEDISEPFIYSYDLDSIY